MTNKEFAEALTPQGTMMENFNSVGNVAAIMRDFYTLSELLEFKKLFDNIINARFNESLAANKCAWERATYINKYLKGDLFTNDGDAEKNKPCQIANSQAIIDRTSSVLRIGAFGK